MKLQQLVSTGEHNIALKVSESETVNVALRVSHTFGDPFKEVGVLFAHIEVL